MRPKREICLGESTNRIFWPWLTVTRPRKRRKRLKEIELNNSLKREDIKQRLEDLRLSSAKREREIKIKNEEFEYVKRNLSPAMDKVKQDVWNMAREQYSQEQLSIRKGMLKPIDLGELKHHSTKINIILKQREVDNILKEDKYVPKESYDPLKFKKNQNNSYFFKKKQFSDYKNKSLKYADKAQKYFEQKSPPNPIKDWEKAQEAKHFGYYYKQSIDRRKEDRRMNWDPNSYLHESIQLAKRSNSVANLEERAKSPPVEEVKPKKITFKELLTKEVDYKKVNDKELKNKDLNRFERLERAKKFIGETKPAVQSSPTVCLVDEMAEKCIRSHNPNIFKKYLNTVQYLEERALAEEKLEKFERKTEKPILREDRKADSIDLLSSCIKSKLKLLGNT
jgi:hypothetical protein